MLRLPEGAGPGAGRSPRQGAGPGAVHPDAVYRLNVDTDGDDVADLAYSFVFSPPSDGRQTVSVHRAVGAGARDHAPGGEVVFSDVEAAFGAESVVVTRGGRRFFAGLRSDPFFADLEGIGNDFQWTGNDFGIDKNVFGIVLEVPDEELGDGPVGVWARVSLREEGRLVSVDRGAHPSLTAYFNAEDAKDRYNEGEPADDWDAYAQPWSAVLAHTGGYSAEQAEQALRTVLPDVLRYDRTRPAAYPNGRTLTDDVTSVRLAMVSGGKITTDRIGPHTDCCRTSPTSGAPTPPPDHPVRACAPVRRGHRRGSRRVRRWPGAVTLPEPGLRRATWSGVNSHGRWRRWRGSCWRRSPWKRRWRRSAVRPPSWWRAVTRPGS